MYPPVTQFETRRLELERRMAQPRITAVSPAGRPRRSQVAMPRVTRLVRAWLTPSA